MTASVANMQILALNNAEQSENRIHSDEIAQRYGFGGALVSGVNVFGYLTQPLVRSYGEEFLNSGMMDVLFLKPAYQDDLLSISSENLGQESSQRSHLTSIFNESGMLLAKLESWLPNQLPAVNELAVVSSGEAPSERPEISWDEIKLNDPAPHFIWQPTQQENDEHVETQRDQSELYQGGNAYLHPYFILDACNKALMRMFYLPAWIHTGSKITLRKALKVGQKIEVKTVPIEKWERKGHQFIKLYIAMWTEDAVAMEVEHSAIFKLADS